MFKDRKNSDYRDVNISTLPFSIKVSTVTFMKNDRVLTAQPYLQIKTTSIIKPFMYFVAKLSSQT